MIGGRLRRWKVKEAAYSIGRIVLVLQHVEKRHALLSSKFDVHVVCALKVV